MNFAQYLTFAVNVLSLFATKTLTTIDDKALSLLQAVQASPRMIEWLESLDDAMPSDAMASTQLPDDVAAIVANDGFVSEKFSAGDLLQYLPILLELLRAWRARRNG